MVEVRMLDPTPQPKDFSRKVSPVAWSAGEHLLARRHHQGDLVSDLILVEVAIERG